GAALISMSLWRATAMLLSDMSADWAEDALDGCVGRAAHWVVLALVMMGYAVHALRAREPGLAPRSGAQSASGIGTTRRCRRAKKFRNLHAFRSNRTRVTPRRTKGNRFRRSF